MTQLMNAPTELIPVDVIEKIRDLEVAAKEIESQQKKLKAEILSAMEEHGVKSWESDDKSVQITYVPESESITLDTKGLKEECRDVYDAYAKVTKRKASVRITVR